MIRYAKLHLAANIACIQPEVAALRHSWNPHFNTKHYEGEWTVLSLRVPGGRTDEVMPDQVHGEDYLDTPLMAACPAIRELLQTFQCPLLAVRLLNLKSGAVIKEHRDHELAYEKGEARLHLPVFTNNKVEFYVEDERVNMQEGECWYINANLPHRVSNHGNTNRIHLVVDCKVNDWLAAQFELAEKKYVPVEKQQHQLMQVIRELRSQQTEVATALADQLEKTLIP
ncbi:MAG TPA: aspartyl/asparaginyl beta-hydroxylase domain-containing protein [Chitinophagaceae bacterium]|nr:aspartyl/asparaginyl beta-hydroxylase domain-containing protein [Chitinophagaceae bacterium]